MVKQQYAAMDLSVMSAKTDFVSKLWTVSKASMWNASSGPHQKEKQLLGPPTIAPAGRGWENSAEQPLRAHALCICVENTALIAL